MRLHVALKVAFDVGELDGDDFETLLDELGGILGNFVLVLYGMAVVGLDPEVNHIDGAFVVHVADGEGDVSCVLVNDVGVHDAHKA